VSIGSSTNSTTNPVTLLPTAPATSGIPMHQQQERSQQQVVTLSGDAPLGLATRGLDPAYLLPLTVCCLKHGKIEVWRLISWGCLAVALRSLASGDPVIRWVGGCSTPLRGRMQ
jgi:hypothetical protein